MGGSPKKREPTSALDTIDRLAILHGAFELSEPLLPTVENYLMSKMAVSSGRGRLFSRAGDGGRASPITMILQWFCKHIATSLSRICVNIESVGLSAYPIMCVPCDDRQETQRTKTWAEAVATRIETQAHHDHTCSQAPQAGGCRQVTRHIR